MDPTAASLKLVYTLGVTSSEIVILSKTISTDLEKKLFDYYFEEMQDKLAATKMAGVCKILLNALSL